MIKLGDENTLLFLGAREAGHVVERHDGPFDLARAGPVRQRPYDIMRLAVAAIDAALERLPCPKDLLNILGKLSVIEIVRDVRQGPTAITRDKTEDPRDGRREAADDEIAVKENGGDL